MKRSLFLAVIVVSLMGNCAKIRPSPSWPARIAPFSGFDPEEASSIQEAIEAFANQAPLNARLITMDEGGFPIYFTKDASLDSTQNRAGLATLDRLHCIIALAPRVFLTYRTHLKSVVWHEMGHCAGLEHSDLEGDIMYRTSKQFAWYTEKSIERFFSTVFLYIDLKEQP